MCVYVVTALKAVILNDIVKFICYMHNTFGVIVVLNDSKFYVIKKILFKCLSINLPLKK